MSQAAVLSTCQIPCRLGLPSGVRGKPDAGWAGGWAACWAGGRAPAPFRTNKGTPPANAKTESRHLGIEAAAFDRRHQSRAIELGVAQVRAIGHLAVGFPSITRPAMTRLAIAFLLVKPHPIRNVGGAGWL